ncbi:MAG TPA: hypothetical protein VL651_07985 [Bacteroidia bacterium]|jgi:hypothetical protein|nr:hypothetical protein [Bacteroidia bacterium]
MQKLPDKLSGLISGLTPAELPLFRASLAGKRNATDAKLLALFNSVVKEVRAEENIADRKEHFRKIFAHQRYDDQKFRYLKTDLVTKLESFIARRGFEKDEALYMQVLMGELASRKSVKSYNAWRLSFEEKRKTPKWKDISFYQHQYESDLVHLAKATDEMKRSGKSNIGEVVEHLDKFYLARKLQLCCEIFNVRNVLAVEHKVFLLEEILGHLKNKSYADVSVIAIYYRILMTLLHSEEEEHFHQLMKLLEKYEKDFSLVELREMYQYVMNYCIKKINLGNIEWTKTLFGIYKTTIANHVLMSEGHLPHLDFKNIVTIGLRLKEFDWVKKFIEENKKFIRAAERQNAYIYNSANLAFNTGDHSRCMKLLQQVEFSDLYYQLDSKSILLKTYFELEETEPFFYHASAFRIFLKRNKLVSEYQRTIYLNLIRYSSQLLRAQGNPKRISAIRKKVEANRNIADLNWLLGKF